MELFSYPNVMTEKLCWAKWQLIEKEVKAGSEHSELIHQFEMEIQELHAKAKTSRVFGKAKGTWLRQLKRGAALFLKKQKEKKKEKNYLSVPSHF